MKKLISGLSALAIAAALAPMSAFAENETGGSTNVTFDAPRNSPEYMITIPASVDLNAENPTATITAENVYLDTTKHKQINVTLDSAQYVETGASTFIAKTADGSSSVTYTIGKGEATTGVKVGDTVAEFTANGDQVLSFSEPTGATYAGTHTETLTFGISVEDAVKVETLLTTITGAGSNTPAATSANVSYSTEGIATLTFSGSVSYQASPAWGWWGYDWTATVTPAEGYTITKCVFYDDANRTATDSEAPFVVETTEEDKTPRINGTPSDGGTSQSKGLKKIEVYGYAN